MAFRIITETVCFIVIAVMAVIAWLESTNLKAAREWLKKHSDDSGQALIEAVLVVPILLLLTLGGIDGLLAATTRADVHVIAGGAAYCASQQGCDPNAVIAGGIAGYSLDPNKLTYAVTPQTISLSYDYTGYSPFIGHRTFSVTAVIP